MIALQRINPTVAILSYDLDLHQGVIEINSETYAMDYADGRVELTHLDERDGLITHTVEVAPTYRCSCSDAKYRPTRPGGCKHVIALREHVAPKLRQMRRECVAV